MRIRTHPGEILLEEFLKPNNLTPHALSLAIGVSSSCIFEIIKQNRGVSAYTAMRLARFFGTTAQFWLNLQTAHDNSIAEEKNISILERVVPFEHKVEVT